MEFDNLMAAAFRDAHVDQGGMPAQQRPAANATRPDQLVDGFLYNPKLLYAPLRYLPLALEGAMPFRNHNYSHRWYSAPADSRVAIASGLTVDTQLRIVPGSVIVGGRFCTVAVGGGAAPSPSLIKYLIRDSNTQKSFVDGESRYLGCNQLVPNGATGAAFSLFAKPYLVSGSEDEEDDDGGGVITVSLTNTSTTTDIKCQLILYVLEPAQIETTKQSGSIMVPYSDKQHESGGHRQHGTHARLRRHTCPV